MIIHLLVRIPKIIKAIKDLGDNREPEIDFDEKQFLDSYNSRYSARNELQSRTFSKDENGNPIIKSYKEILDSDPELAKRIGYNKLDSTKRTRRKIDKNNPRLGINKKKKK